MLALCYALLVIAGATFVVETAFMLLYSAKRALEAGVLPFEARMVAYTWLVLGYPADVLFNLTRGTIMFRELPKELLFTSRVQRHIMKSDGWRLDKAVAWASFLNTIDPGHVKVFGTVKGQQVYDPRD